MDAGTERVQAAPHHLEAEHEDQDLPGSDEDAAPAGAQGGEDEVEADVRALPERQPGAEQEEPDEELLGAVVRMTTRSTARQDPGRRRACSSTAGTSVAPSSAR
jgi:hypothetical protein